MSSLRNFVAVKDYDHENFNHRTMFLNFDDGDYESAGLNADHWRLIMPIALRGASADLRDQILEELEKDEITSVDIPVCDHSLSLFELLHVIDGTTPPVAMELIKCWMEIPLKDRVSNAWTYLGHNAVHAQLRAKIDAAEPVFASRVPAWLTDVIDAAYSTGLTPPSGVQWSYADTPLGKTCVAHSYRDAGACLVISDCDVRYLPAGAEGPKSALAAVDLLQAYLNEAEVLQVEMPDKHLSAHEVLKMGATMEEWRERILTCDR